MSALPNDIAAPLALGIPPTVAARHENGAIGFEARGVTMRFGGFTALDDVSIAVAPGSFHALLGENGAGKSTLVKCAMGFNRATKGQFLVAGREVDLPDPRAAHALGLGMVYQHFTLVPSLTAAENLVISRPDAPHIIDWRAERARLEAFLDTMPFRVPLTVPADRLSAGERQKLEILKQLYLGRRFLILDEPTSVLDPAEADEVLGTVRALTQAGEVTVLMITHKFREVTGFADDVTVLRAGHRVGGGPVAGLTHADLGQMMVGAALPERNRPAAAEPGAALLQIEGLRASDASGFSALAIDDLCVHSGEIVGVAGVSGNGQTALMEVLCGQRAATSGTVRVAGAPYAATRTEMRERRVRCLPEEPLRNACAPRMSVAENIALRSFDVSEAGPRLRLDRKRIASEARQRIASFGIRASSPDLAIETLSGGNVQRAVLARELSGDVALLIVANPCFGLDVTAVDEIRTRIVAARDAGTAILLISEDLDEILELCDRIVVMSEGGITYRTDGATRRPRRDRPPHGGARLMTEARTIEAAPFAFPFAPETLALVVIDMQRDFLEPGGFGASLGNDVSHLREIVPTLAGLLRAFRERGLTVIHTRESHAPDLSDCPPAKRLRGEPRLRIGDAGPMGRLLVRGEPGTEIVPELAPEPGEIVIDKPGKGAFYATQLSAVLEARGIRQLLVTGVTTEVCVQSTAREANDRGYDVCVVEDATASYVPAFKAATLDMIRSQGAIVGWTASAAAVHDALTDVAPA